MLNNLESKILNKIHQKKIKPLKKWVLILRQVLVWFLVLLFLTIGGLSFSVMSVILFYGDWSIYSHLADNLGSFFLLTFPYLWLILFLTFLFLGLKRLRRAKNTYHRRPSFWVILALFFILLSGTTFSHLGVGRCLENYLADNFLAYRKVNNMRSIWNNPARGLLSGTIESFSNDGLLILKDFSNNNWQINYQNAKISTTLEVGKKIKLLGERSDVSSFAAKEINSWNCLKNERNFRD